MWIFQRIVKEYEAKYLSSYSLEEMKKNQLHFLKTKPKTKICVCYVWLFSFVQMKSVTCRKSQGEARIQFNMITLK